MSTRISSAGLTARMLRRRPGPALVVTALSILLAIGVAVVPAVLQTLGDRVVREAVADLSPGERDLEATAPGQPAVGPGETDLPPEVAAVWGAFDASLADVRAGIASPLGPLVAPAEYYTRSGEMSVQERRTDTLTFLMDPRFADRAVLVDGAWPRYAPVLEREDGALDVPVVEIALSVASAEAMDWPVGETRTVAWAQGPIPVRLVGTFEAAPGTADYWYHAPSVLSPQIVYNDLIPFPTAAALIAPEYLVGVPLTGGGTTTVWYPLDPATMAASDATEVAAQLRAFTANAVRVGDGAAALGAVEVLSFDTSAVDALEQALGTQSAMTAVFALTASGPAGAAVAVLAVACRVIARGRRSALALLSARGASAGRLRALQAWHGVWFGTVPALVAGGAVIAGTTVLSGAVSAAAVLGVLAVAVAPPVILAAIPPPGPRLGEEVSAEPTPAQRRRRLVVEAGVILLAFLAAAALVSDALAGERVGSGPVGSVLVLLVPLLAALVGCVVALRLYPLPLRALFTRLRRSHGLTGFLGAARSLREGAAGVAPVLALLIGVSSATMSGVLLGSIQHEIDSSAHSVVGADLQIGRADLTDEALERIASVPGVAQVAPVGSVTRTTLRGTGGDQLLVTMLVVDPDLIAAVQDPAYPLVPAGADLGAPGGTIPLVLAELTSSQLDGATDVFVNARDAEVTAVSSVSAPQGITDVWAVISADRVADIVHRAPAVRNAYLRLDAGADAAAVAASVRDIVGEGATVLTAATMADELSQRTGTTAIRIALLSATAAAALFGALAVMLSLVLSAAARDRLFGLLRALGAPARVGRGLAWWELWPPLTASVLVGLVVGLAVPALLLATVDFGVFVDAQPAYHLDPLLLGGAILGFLALTAVFTVAALALSRRVRATAALRQSQEG